MGELRLVRAYYGSSGYSLLHLHDLPSRWVDMLVDTGRKLDRAEAEPLAAVGDFLRQLGSLQYAQVGDCRATLCDPRVAGDLPEEGRLPSGGQAVRGGGGVEGGVRSGRAAPGVQGGDLRAIRQVFGGV